MAQRKKVSRSSASKKTKASKSSASRKPARKPVRAKKALAKAVRGRAASARKGKPAKARRPKKAAGRKPASQKPIQLYYWVTPNGWKTAVFLEEARLPYEIRPVDPSKGEQLAPEFAKICPNNKIPAIVDAAGPGRKPLSVFEAGAILQYLGAKTGKLYPSDPDKRAKVDEWLFWEAGNLGPMAGQTAHFSMMAPERIPYAIERFTSEMNRLLGVLESQFKDGRDFIAGRYSIADIAIYCWLAPMPSMGLASFDEFPHLKAWLERVGARPAVKRGMAVGEGLRKGPLVPPKAGEGRPQQAKVA